MVCGISDVVYVGSINPQHLSLAKLALDAGKPVLCEKPLCMNVKEAKELIAFAQSKNLFLMEVRLLALQRMAYK